MVTQAEAFERASAMPAATWHFLDANDVAIPIPAGLEITPNVQVTGGCDARGDAEALEHALDDAQARWEGTHPAPTAEEIAERRCYREAESDATYGGTAQSAYQVRAEALEEVRSLSASFEHGTGAQVASFLGDAAGERVVLQALPGCNVQACVTVGAAQGVVSVAAIDIVALSGSNVDVSIVVDSLSQELGEAQEHEGAQELGLSSARGGFDALLGIAGTTLRVFADDDACVRIARVQTLDAGFTDIDDMALFASERARIDVRQTVLGATATFTGLAGDLRGDSARVDVDTRYLGHGGQSHDFNYMLRHHGTRTRSNLVANGVLSGKSSKTLRGTIDLVRGCKGSEGSENETVLLVDEAVRNKTVPVILCNEDDVAGNHGATIGHIREEQLFYLESRGLSREAAEAMFVGAVLERAAIDAPDEASHAAVVRLGEKLVSGFVEILD